MLTSNEKVKQKICSITEVITVRSSFYPLGLREPKKWNY